jgi:hypothetical protein
VLVGLRDGLRSGDVFVPGSRRYADPASFLLTALGDLQALLAKGTAGQVRLTDDGELIIPPLTAEDVPAEADRCSRDAIRRCSQVRVSPGTATLRGGAGPRPR